MKNTKFCIAAIMLLLAGSFGSCNKPDTPETMDTGTSMEDLKSVPDTPEAIDIDAFDINAFMEQLKSAPHAYTAKESLPEWLLYGRINEAESTSTLFRQIEIYEGEWDSQTVYLIRDGFSSRVFDLYTEKGERFTGNPTDAASKNWTLIYKFGELPFPRFTYNREPII